MSARGALDDASAESRQGASAEFAFDAFISYRRSDGAKAARRLRQKLQRFDIRKRLKHLRSRKLRVFLDAIYERGADDFYERNILPSLLASRRLIVLATPDAVKRPGAEDWIQREINDFRTHRGAENILVVRAAGDFLATLPGDLNVSAPNIQIIDLRHDGVWSALAPLRSSRLADEWIKLAAPLFDVSTEDMPRLRREQERAQQRALAILGGALAGAIGFAVALSWFALSQQRQAEQTLDNSLFAASRVIETASALSLPDEQADQKRAMLMTACDLFDNLADEAARSKFEMSILDCDIDRVSALIESGEFDRARSFHDRLNQRIRESYAEKKDLPWAIAMSSMLDLSMMLNLSAMQKDSDEQKNAVLGNTKEYGDVFKAHAVGRLAEGYSRRVWLGTEMLERLGDFKGSAELMVSAASLFEAASKNSVPQADSDAAELQAFATKEAASFFRRIGWARVVHLDDASGGLDASEKSLEIVRAGLARTASDSGDLLDLRWEEALAHEGRGNALVLKESYPESLEAYQASRTVTQLLLGLGLNDAFRKQVEAEDNYLQERIAGISSALTGEAP